MQSSGSRFGKQLVQKKIKPSIGEKCFLAPHCPWGKEPPLYHLDVLTGGRGAHCWSGGGGITERLAASFSPDHGSQLPAQGTFRCPSQGPEPVLLLVSFVCSLHPLAPIARLGQPHRRPAALQKACLLNLGKKLTIIHVLNHFFIHSLINSWIH